MKKKQVSELVDKYQNVVGDIDAQFRAKVLEIGQSNVSRILNVHRSYITNILKSQSCPPETKIEILKKIEAWAGSEANFNKQKEE